MMQNQTVISGTRIPIRAVKAFAAAGYSTEQIIEQYPELTPNDVAMALLIAEAA